MLTCNVFFFVKSYVLSTLYQNRSLNQILMRLVWVLILVFYIDKFRSNLITLDWNLFYKISIYSDHPLLSKIILLIRSSSFHQSTHRSFHVCIFLLKKIFLRIFKYEILIFPKAHFEICLIKRFLFHKSTLKYKMLFAINIIRTIEKI